MHSELPLEHADCEVGKGNPELFKMIVNFSIEQNSTQYNESLNNLISMLAPKKLNFANSYNVRVLIVCGIYNEIQFYSNLLKEKNLDRFIPDESMHRVIEYENLVESRNVFKRTSQYIEKKKKQRKKLYTPENN